MSDITHIFGGPFTVKEKHVDPPEIQLAQAMRNAGIEPPNKIEIDGQLHRFGTKGRKKDNSGWYIAFSDGTPAGRFGCWRDGIEVGWSADIGRELTAAESMALTRRMSEARAARDAEQAKKREVAADTVASIWEDATGAKAEHPYLARKSISPNGARVTGDGRLMVPLFDPDGNLSSIQYIDAEGEKRYHPGGATGGMGWHIGELRDKIYICEGFATAATVHEATGEMTVIAYSASNLPKITGNLREKYTIAQEIIIVADNDKSKIGQKYADQAAAKYGAKVIIPPTDGDANDYAQAGGDVMELLNPPATEWLIPADDFSSQPAPIRWLVKHWLQDKALIMAHGPSGGGKTFVVLDWTLKMAAGIGDWFGHKVRPGSVVYLAGEGHHGLRSRIALWKQEHGNPSLNMWLSKSGCDLNTPEGYQKAAEAIRSLDELPSIIVVDTLHRFLSGDENSAQDAKTMLDACAALMEEFGCSVLLVHHTGVSDEAQHRARGSSAWKGALDIEISVKPATEDNPIEIIQRKSKDAEAAETVFVDLQSIPIKGWLDEDGEPVTSAILVEGVAPIAAKKDPLAKQKKTFDQIWSAKKEIKDDKIYMEREHFIAQYMTSMGCERAAALKQFRPGNGKLMGQLETGMVIKRDEKDGEIIGFFVEELDLSAQLFIKAKGS